MWNIQDNKDTPQWKKDLDYCRFVIRFEHHMENSYVNACRSVIN